MGRSHPDTFCLLKNQCFSYISWAIAFDLCIFWSNSLKQPSSCINSNSVFLNPFALPLSLSLSAFLLFLYFLIIYPVAFQKGNQIRQVFEGRLEIQKVLFYYSFALSFDSYWLYGLGKCGWRIKWVIVVFAHSTFSFLSTVPVLPLG